MATQWEGDIEFRVLGPIEVRLDGATLDVGGPRQRRLLAALLIDRGHVVSVDALVDRVWDDDERPDGATQAIRTYVSRVRRSLTAAGAVGDEILRTEPPGYRLTVGAGHSDADAFAARLADARSEASSPQERLGAIESALELWRGAPFAELAGVPWADAAAAPLQELHAVALEERAGCRLDLGAHAEVVAELEQLVAHDPLRARPVELLALALARSNREVDALRVIEDLRRGLAEAGLSLPSAVAELDHRIVAQDSSLFVVEPPTDQLRGYELAERIGEGAFSLVYRGVQPAVGREVAIKQIRSELANRPEFIRRFEAEAHTVASLEHPFIVPLYDFWREPGAAFLVMRWLRGGTLESTLLDRRLEPAEAARMVQQIGGALALAHAAGVVHRDVKSANVFLDDEGNFYLGDFGIAVDISAQGDPEDALSAGSPAYAAPEQLRRLPVGPSADVHGLGIVLYEALTGHLPFPEAKSHAELLQRQLHDAVPSVVAERPELAPGVDEVIRRATAKQPHERYATVAELVRAFDDAVDGAEPGGEGQTAALGTVTTVGDAANPYKGLRAFQESDSDDFFGRDRLVDRLLEAMSVDGPESRLVAAVGPSGSGKSSVVRAGLLPRLRAGGLAGSQRWFFSTMIPGRDPFEELEAALNRIATHPTTGLVETMRDDPRGIARAVKSSLPEEGTELVLVIDQFEELFTLVEDESMRRRFLEGLLAAAAEPRSQLRVVATIRADFWDRPLRYPELARLLERSAVTVPPMAADELERAITDPAQRVGVAFEPGLVSVIMADVRDEPGSLPLMQYALTELYERRVSGLMRLEDYRELGGVAGALARRAEDLYSAGSVDGQAAMRHLFTRLVTPGEGTEDTRRRVLQSELARVPGEVIERLGAARLLSFDRDPATREPTVEVAHEALIRVWPRLRSWLDEDRDGLRVARHLTTAARDWDTRGRPTEDVYRGGRLELAESWADGRDAELTGVETAFLAASIDNRTSEEAAERARVRRLRRLVAATAVVAALALVAGAVALVQQRRASDAEERASDERDLAEAEAQRADEQAAVAVEARDAAEAAQEDAEAQRLQSDLQRMAAEAVTLPESNQDLALLLAVEAANRWDDPLALGAVFEVLARDTGLITTLPGPPGRNDGWVGFLDDETLVMRSANGIHFYDVVDRQLIREVRAPGRLSVFGTVVADTSGGAFATLTTEGTALVFTDADSDPIVVDVGPEALAVDVTPDGAIAVGYRSGDVKVFTGPTLGTEVLVGRHAIGVTGVAWDPDAQLLVSTDADHTVTSWTFDGATAEPQWTLTHHGSDAWVEDSARSVPGIGPAATTRTQGVILGGPPELDPALEPVRVNANIEIGVDADRIYVLSDARVLYTLDAADAAGIWQVSGSLIRGGMQALPSGGVLWQNRVVSADGLVRELVGDATLRTAMSPDGTMLATHGLDGVALRSLGPDRLLATALPRNCADFVTLSPDGTLLASQQFDQDCESAEPGFGLIEVATGERLPVRLPPSWMSFTAEGDFHHTTFGPEGRRENFLDPRTQEPTLPALNPEDGGWGAFEVAGDGRIYLADINDPEVRVYDAQTGERLMTLTHPDLTARGTGGLPYLDVTDDASLVAVGGGSTTVVWDTATGETAGTFDAGADQFMTEVQFIDDTRLWIVGSNQIEEVDVATGARSVVATGVLQASGIYNVNPIEPTDNGLVVLAGQEGVALYERETWRKIGPTISGGSVAFGASIAAGGRFAVTATESDLLVWNLDPESWREIACEAAGRNMTLDEWETFGPIGVEYNATCPQWPSDVG